MPEIFERACSSGRPGLVFFVSGRSFAVSTWKRAIRTMTRPLEVAETFRSRKIAEGTLGQLILASRCRFLGLAEQFELCRGRYGFAFRCFVQPARICSNKDDVIAPSEALIHRLGWCHVTSSDERMSMNHHPDPRSIGRTTPIPSNDRTVSGNQQLSRGTLS